MPELPLKYGCNPNQSHARVVQPDGEPLRCLNGRPSYINVLDGLRGWQLVRELKAATGHPAAASYKHVSPAGAAVCGDAAELTPAFRQSQFIKDGQELSPVAAAYAKARSSDRVASFGDFIAVSEPVDATLAALIKPEVSDGIIAPAFDDDALAVLKQKKKGGYVIFTIDPSHEPAPIESRTEFGLTLEQSHNDLPITPALFDDRPTQRKDVTDAEVDTALVATVTLKHTQSNSVCVGYASQAVGVGAGQQSRIACTRLACDKADRWFLKMHPKALGLAYAPKLPRSEKVNALEMFVRLHELDGPERAQFERAVPGPVEALTQQERADFLGAFRDAGGVVLSSDAFYPFRDNLDRAARSGVGLVVQAGGSARDADVVAAANEHAMTMCITGIRLFLH